MYPKIINLLLLLCYFSINSQSINKQVVENIHKINSVNPSDTIFSDLHVIGDAIGNAKVVFLGEQDHGDATTFEAKTRIIKYLHEKKGFDVLAFESDFFNINKKADENKSIDEIEKSIYPIWSNCAQVNPLFNYIKKQQKTNPITISGFDCQIAQNYKDDTDRVTYINTIRQYIEKNVDITELNHYQLFLKTLQDLLFFIKATAYKKAHFKEIDKTIQEKYFNTLASIMSKINNKNTFLFKSLENVLYYAKMAWKKKDGHQGRDIQMGKNILWLHKTKFPAKKIIVWAHSAHLIKKIYNKKGKRVFFQGNITTSAGTYVYNQLDENIIYSIGFTSRKGKTHRTSLNTKASKQNIKLPKKNSFENWVHSKGIQFGFINFKSLKNNYEDFYMKGFSHYNFKTNWLTAFDGIFYIDEMFPCIREK